MAAARALAAAALLLAVVYGGRTPADLERVSRELNALESRIQRADSTIPGATSELGTKAGGPRFEETSVSLRDVPAAPAPQPDVAGAVQPADSRTDAQWREVAEAAVKHEQTTTREANKQILDLQQKLAEANRHVQDLDEELVEASRQQQESLLSEVRKEERLRARQEQFMAKKFADYSAKTRRTIAQVQADARANVTEAHQLLILEKQRGRNATLSVASLKQEAQKWQDVAERSLAAGKGKAEALEQLKETKLHLRAATHVAEQWRAQSLEALKADIILGNLGNKNLSLAEAGKSPQQYKQAMKVVMEEEAKIEKKKAEEAKQKKAFEKQYGYPSWELHGRGPVSRHSSAEFAGLGSRFAPSDPLSFLNSPLPPTGISDNIIRQ